MTSKKLLYIGLIIFLVSTIGGSLGTVLAFFDFFSDPNPNEKVGLDAFYQGVYIAMIFSLIGTFGIIIGLILMIIGGIKLSQTSKSNDQLQ